MLAVQQKSRQTNRWGSCDAYDRPAFSRSIAALEDDDNAQPFVPHPFLQLAELDLKFEQFLFVFLAFEFRFLWGRLGGILHEIIIQLACFRF